MMDHYAAVAAAAAGVGMAPVIKRTPTIRVKNLSISDVYTHQIIFQRVYTWKATTAFSNLGNLIESFYQFARTVDDGAVVGIDFESTPKENLRRRRDDSLWDVRGDTMHMMTLKTTDFTATAFFDLCGHVLISPEDEKSFKIFLHTVKISFEHLYLDTLRTIRNQHQMLCKQHPDEPIMMNTGVFADFMSLVDAIHELVFNNPNRNTSNNTNANNPNMNNNGSNINTNSNRLNNMPGPHNNTTTNINGNNNNSNNNNNPNTQILRDEHQLDDWLLERTPQPLSVEEEVRQVLENVNIFLPEIILDRMIPPTVAQQQAAAAAQQQQQQQQQQQAAEYDNMNI